MSKCGKSLRSSVHVPIHAHTALYSAKRPMAEIRDARFARLHYDPRFQRLPKKERKAVADDRFAAMHHDGAFNDDATVMDKRGHALQQKRAPKKAKAKAAAALPAVATGAAGKKAGKAKALPEPVPLPAEDEEEEDYSDDEEELDDEEEFDDEGEEEEEDDDEGEGETSSATESDVSDDEDEAEGDKSALVGWLEQSHGDGVPRVSDGTRRLAVVNLNWDHVRSVDILAVLRSFVPAGGRILSVTVYPSEFGEQRMAEEATVGPGGLLASKSKKRSGKSVVSR